MKPVPHRAPLPAGMLPALDLLLKAHGYAADLGGTPWDFAVEIDSLRALGLTDTDLRWLAGRGYVAHAPETTRPGARRRTFGPCGGPTFARRTCFVLTAAGVAAARGSGHGPRPNPAARLTHFDTGVEPAAGWRPRWDARARELWLGGCLVKRLRQPAPNQEAILAAFEEEGWPRHVDDPLPPRAGLDPKARLHRAIDNLNRARRLTLLHFFACAKGEAVGWELVRPASAGDATATPERRQSGA